MKCRIHTIITILFLSSTICWAQNLVSNSSFEDVLNCPNDFDQLYKSDHWTSVGGTVDLFGECSIEMIPDPANGPFTYATFLFDSTYTSIGLSFPFRFRSDTIFREYMQGELSNSLDKKSYYFSIHAYTNRSNRTNHLGIYFSEKDVGNIGAYPKNITPQLEFDEWIGEYHSWKRHEGCIDDIEDSNFIVIGNFHEPGKDSVEFADIEFTNRIFLDNLLLTEIPKTQNELLELNLGECIELDSFLTEIPVEYYVDNIILDGFTICPEETILLEQRIKACGKVTKSIEIDVFNCDCEVYFPNIINPNSQNTKNRTISIGTDEKCIFSINDIKLYDRWGNKIYQGQFDKFDALDLISGVYIYDFTYNCRAKLLRKSGDLTIIK